MKKNISILIFTILINSSSAQTSNWGWLKNIQGLGSETFYDIETDIYGNVYATGIFAGTSITIGSTVLTNSAGTSSSRAFYIIKFDMSGNVLWAKSSKSTELDNIRCLDTDASGNLLIAGSFSSDSLIFDSDTLYAGTNTDALIMKYDTFGNNIWTKEIDGAGGLSVSSDRIGNVFVLIGTASPYIIIGPDIYYNDYALSVNIKYDSSGNLLWSRAATSTCSFGMERNAVDSVGNNYVVGSGYLAPVIFDTISTFNPSSIDGFLAKYDSAGNILWLRQFSANSFDYAVDVVVDAIGDVYVAGYYNSSALAFMGGTPYFGTNIYNAGSYDNYIVKYNSLGNFQWSKSIGGSGSDFPMGIATDGVNIFVCGTNGSSSTVYGPFTLTGTGNDKVFVAKMNAIGSYLWVQQAVSSINGMSGGPICSDNFGNQYIGGSYTYNAIFGATTLVAGTPVENYIAQIPVPIPTQTDQRPLLNKNFNLFPNPSNSSSAIFYELTDEEEVTIEIYNELGEVVKIIAKNEIQSVGEHSYSFTPNKLGIYLVNVKIGGNSSIGKLVFVE